MKAEPVSYDVITPTAARGILEAIYWKPEMTWRIERLHVLNPIRFENCRRNEVDSKIPAGSVAAAMGARSTAGLGCDVAEHREPRASILLRDVAYVIEARIDLSTKGWAAGDSIEKHVAVAVRRVRKGQYFHHPCLGTREFACEFEMIDGDPPSTHPSLMGERDLGWMLHSIDYGPPAQPRFYRPIMRDGVIEVPR
jgi:CRISPR-associated protein Cas5d